MAAEVAHQGEPGLGGQLLQLQLPEEVLSEAVAGQGVGKADDAHLEALGQVAPTAPQPGGQRVLVSLKAAQSVGQQPGVVIPAPLAHQNKGVLNRLDVSQGVEGAEHIFPAVHGGVVQIAQELFRQRTALFPHRGIAGGGDVGEKGLLHGRLLPVGLGQSEDDAPVLLGEGGRLLRLIRGPVLDGLVKGGELLNVPQAAEELVGAPDRHIQAGADQIGLPALDPPLLPPLHVGGAEDGQQVEQKQNRADKNIKVDHDVNRQPQCCLLSSSIV